MRYRLLDVLACPACKSFPMDLAAFETVKVSPSEGQGPLCELYCGYSRNMVKDGLYDCDSCTTADVVSGILLCHSCRRWYRIDGGLPVLLPDHLRDKNDDLNFLRRFRSEIREDISESWLPIHL